MLQKGMEEKMLNSEVLGINGICKTEAKKNGI